MRHRVVIPYDLRHEVLDMLHGQLVGIARMKLLTSIIDEDIEQHVTKNVKVEMHQAKPFYISYY